MTSQPEPASVAAAKVDVEMHHGTHPAAEVWAYSAAGWLLCLSMPLLVFPRLLILLSSPPSGPTPEHHPLTLTPLENFLSMHFGILLIALAVCLVMSIPHASPVAPRPGGEPARHPLLAPLSGAFGVTSFASYHSSITSIGAFPMIVCVGAGLMSLWGFWVMFFAGDGVYSKKTGADKRTSAFLFGNKNAVFEQKKQWKKDQKDN